MKGGEADWCGPMLDKAGGGIMEVPMSNTVNDFEEKLWHSLGSDRTVMLGKQPRCLRRENDP
jgi:hypothetical protein